MKGISLILREANVKTQLKIWERPVELTDHNSGLTFYEGNKEGRHVSERV